MCSSDLRISAAVLSLALGFATIGAPVFTPTALAQTSISAGQVSTVNLNTPVSLTINKYQGLPVADPADLTNLPPLAAEFTIEKVVLTNGLDTLAGWQEVANLTPATVNTDATFNGTGDLTVTTDSITGSVLVDADDTTDFTAGVYLVTESPLTGHTVAKPFLVTLPFTDATTDGWNYHQVVNPKNQADILIEKDVRDPGATLGSTLNYTITAPLPAGDLSSLSIVDDLPDELTPATTVVVSTKVDATATPVAFPLTDTTPVLDDGDGNQLTIDFGPTDLAALQGMRLTNPALELVVTFTADILSLPSNGIIENHAVINLPGGLSYSTDDPNDPNDGAQTRLGSLIINNLNADGDPLTVAGAEFQLWRCSLNNSNKWEVSDGPISAVQEVGGVPTTMDTFISDGSGIASVTGVQLANWVNNGAPAFSTPPIDEDLCVVQTLPPADHVLNPEPSEVTTVGGDDFVMTADVTNLEDSITGQLPATGGGGTLAMIAAGVLVAIAGGFAALRGNRGGTRARR